MQKFKRIKVQGVDSETSDKAALSSRMGQERDQIAHVVLSFFKEFLKGGDFEKLFAQSSSGIQFQKLNPVIRVEDQFEQDAAPLISFDVGLLIDEEADLAPGIEFNRRLKRIIQRISGKLPITINLKARSDEEIALLQWAVRQIFGTYVHRLYRGLLLNIESSWQIGFPKKLELSSKTFELAEGGSGADEQYKITDIVFSVLYDSVFVELDEKTEIGVIPGPPPPLSITNLGLNDIIPLGSSSVFSIAKVKPLLSYYLDDRSIGRISINKSETLLTLFGKKIGTTNLVVKTSDEEVFLPIQVGVV